MSVYGLPDGRRYVIRPIRGDDGPNLRSGFAQMSARARFLRFHTDRKELKDGEIEHLVNCDGVNRIAFVAVGIDEDGEEIAEIGVVRCYRTEDPTVAEVAFLVLDRWQGLGIGTQLLRVLAERCREVGITHWAAQVLGENEGAFRLLERIGTICAREWSQGVAELRVDLTSR